MRNAGDWRLISDRNKALDKNLLNIDVLNGLAKNSLDEETHFFNINLIEYYDNTSYLNIYSDLPSCVIRIYYFW